VAPQSLRWRSLSRDSAEHVRVVSGCTHPAGCLQRNRTPGVGAPIGPRCCVTFPSAHFSRCSHLASWASWLPGQPGRTAVRDCAQPCTLVERGWCKLRWKMQKTGRSPSRVSKLTPAARRRVSYKSRFDADPRLSRRAAVNGVHSPLTREAAPGLDATVGFVDVFLGTGRDASAPPLVKGVFGE